MNKLKPGHFKAYVWDDPKYKHRERIVVDILKQCCYVVDKNNEQSYYDGGDYHTTPYKHFEKIKEPQMRSMTNEEMISFLLENNVMVRKTTWAKDDFFINYTFDNYSNPGEWQWRKSFDDEYQSFTIEDKEEIQCQK